MEPSAAAFNAASSTRPQQELGLRPESHQFKALAVASGRYWKESLLFLPRSEDPCFASWELS